VSADYYTLLKAAGAGTLLGGTAAIRQTLVTGEQQVGTTQGVMVPVGAGGGGVEPVPLEVAPGTYTLELGVYFSGSCAPTVDVYESQLSYVLLGTDD
jgi:hypothetical protein